MITKKSFTSSRILNIPKNAGQIELATERMTVEQLVVALTTMLFKKQITKETSTNVLMVDLTPSLSVNLVTKRHEL